LRCRTAATEEASALPPPRCCRRAVSRRRASRCRHRLAAAKLPPTSRCRAAATAAASALLPPHCHRRAVRRRRASRFRRSRLECRVADLSIYFCLVFFSTCVFFGLTSATYLVFAS
jgi:hypothetical protein